MGERTPYTQRVDEDLQDFVEFVTESTNLSRADVIDEALRRLRNNSVVSDEGQFIVNGDYDDRATNGDEITNEELFENQQEIIQLLGDRPTLSKSKDPDKNSKHEGAEREDGIAERASLDAPEEGVLETEQRMAALASEYDHDECLKPEDVEKVNTRESDILAHTSRYLVPAITGMLNHEVEHGTLQEPVEWAEIREIMRTHLDVSRGSIYNYREKLVLEEALFPHPSIDEEVVGEKRVTEAREYAAAVVDKRSPSHIDISGLKDLKRERYADDADAYLAEFVGDWKHNAYYLTEDVYREHTWGLFQEAIVNIALTGKSLGRRPNRDKTEMHEAERAAGADRMLVGLVNRFDVAKNSLHEVRDEATDASPDDKEEWVNLWGEVQAKVEAELFGEEADEDDAREVFREVVGVNPDKSDEKEMLSAWRDWVKKNHPDMSGSQEEIDRDEFRRVAEARQVLLA